MTRRSVVAVVAGALAAALLAGGPAKAVGTRRLVLEGLAELSGGDLTGVAVGSDGVVRAGWTLGKVALGNATAVFAALLRGDGSVAVGTGPEGKVYLVSGDRAEVAAETGQLAVTALLETPQGLLAATMPEGKIFRIAGGKASVLAKLPGAEHVWALAWDRAHAAVFAATGPEGKIFRVTPGGIPSVYYDSEEPHVVSLAVDDRTGDLLAGTSGRGLLYRVRGPGRAEVLHDTGAQEVKAVAMGRGGIVWALVNEYSDPPEPPRRTPAATGRSPASPSTSSRPKPGRGSLYRYDSEGRPERVMRHEEHHYTALCVDERGRPYVGTGAEGRVYTVDDARAVTLVADVEERTTGALVFPQGKAGAGAWLLTGDPATARRVTAVGGADAVWTSKVLDAGLRARFGRLSWTATGPLSFSTRTGNTSKPDTTWSPWSADLQAPAPITSPAARFIQVRARWTGGGDAMLTEVVVPLVTDNARAIVTEVTATQKGVSRDARTGLVPSVTEVPRHDAVVKVTWKVDNPDGDPLRYRLTYRREGGGPVRDLLRPDEVHTRTELDWDTQALPEGRYRIRVEASDELANPPDRVERHALESSVVLVDNTPPRITELSLTGRRLKARAVDGLGPITRAEVALDGRPEFFPLAPADGIFDTAEEVLDADLTALLPKGPRLVTLRVFDAAGNFAVKEVDVR